MCHASWVMRALASVMGHASWVMRVNTQGRARRTAAGRSLMFMASWFVGAVLGCCGAAIAQERLPDYPTRPIRIVVAASAGAGGDMMARAVAQMLVDAWGQNTIVDNRPGGSGTIGVELVARSAPDGHTMLALGDTLMILGATK